MRRWVAGMGLALLGACAGGPAPRAEAQVEPRQTQSSQAERAVDPQAVVAELVGLHGEAARPRIEQGVRQVAALWRAEDGDLAAFAREHFVPTPEGQRALLARLEGIFEQLDGHLNEMGRALRWATDVEAGPLLPVDPLLAGYEPSAHLADDLFANKVAFVALLNFPVRPLEALLQEGAGLSREEWAAARLTSRFAQRIPAAVQQGIAEATSRADLYIAQYNVWMHHLLDGQPGRAFPKGLRLISHWNLRDELKAAYKEEGGLRKQRLILQVMERIVTQSIPQAVIDNPRLDWNPFTNEVVAAPADTVEEGAPEGRTSTPEATPEPDRRYAHLLANFHAQRRADPYVPFAPTALARSFQLGREMPEERVVALLTSVLSAPAVPKVAKEIERRLGRPLGPQDLWFNGFRAGPKVPEAQLDARVRQRYPTAEAYAKDMPRLLEGLGFSREKARFLAEHIRVDPSRGAGHAMQAMRRGDFPRLRTRVEKGGMNYKGFNIAVHEMGHNAEQVFSLYAVDHTLLAGVPGNAFTEALAFLFQARDLELLGLGAPDAAAERERVLNDFWQTWEIAGVALVDIAVWHWMYEHPDATAAQLKEAVVRIAREHWDRYYAPVLGGQGSALLGIYSHMVSYPLYLADYPLGHLIAFQLEEQVRKAGALGPEFERMARFGRVVPDVWMEHATGRPVSAEPLLKATEAALAQQAR